MLGLDVGGTKLAAALVDRGRVLRAARCPTPRSGVWDAVAALLDEARDGAAVAEHARLEFLHDLRVVPAELGQRAGLVGAAALIARELDGAGLRSGGDVASQKGSW